MFKILIDTCVWLDLAKDPKQHVLIDVLSELIKGRRVSLIVPNQVAPAFASAITRRRKNYLGIAKNFWGQFGGARCGC